MGHLYLDTGGGSKRCREKNADVPSRRRAWKPEDFFNAFQAAIYQQKRPECSNCRRTMRVDQGWAWCYRCKRGRAEPIGVLEKSRTQFVYRKSDIIRQLCQTFSRPEARDEYRTRWLTDESVLIVNDCDAPESAS